MARSYLPADNSGIERILVEFEMLVDVDFGVIKTIANYYHTEYFSTCLLDADDENIWLGLIHDNLTTNPVECVMNPDIDDAEDFYECLMQEEEMLVYSQACMTNLYDMLIASIGTNGLVEVTILCKNDTQKQIVEGIFPWINNNQYMSIEVQDYDPNNPDQKLFSVAPYSSLFVRHADYLLNRYTNLDGKSVYLYECLTNLDVQEYKKGTGLYPHPFYSGMLGDICYIRVISLYQYDNSYFLNRNYPFTDEEISDQVDEVLDEGLGLEEADEEAVEYDEFIAEAGIPIDAPESDITELNIYDDSEVYDDVSPDETNLDIEELIKGSIPEMDEEPDLSYLDELLEKEEEDNYDE